MSSLDGPRAQGLTDALTANFTKSVIAWIYILVKY